VRGDQYFLSVSLQPREGKPPPEQCDALEAGPMRLDEALS